MEVLNHVLGKACLGEDLRDVFYDRGGLRGRLQDDCISSKECRKERIDEDEVRILQL